MKPRSKTPAGWLTGADLVYRVTDAFHEIASSLGRPPITGEAATSAAVAMLGVALSQPRPSIAAFVCQGEWFVVPSRAWISVVDACENGDTTPLAAALLSPTLPAIFEEYSGEVALYGHDNVTDFVSRLSNATGKAAVVEVGVNDAPWLPRSPSSWLSSEASGDWANARLRQQGLRVDERGRRVEFAKAIERHRAGFAQASIAKTRNRAGYTIAKGI